MSEARGTQTLSALWSHRSRFARAIKSFVSSEAGGKAKALLAALVAMLMAVNGLNVVNSYVGRDFMTAIEQHDLGSFERQTLLYLVVFAASTAVAVITRFAEERLALLWREWLTRRQVAAYLKDHAYYRLRESGELGNPDQRMAEDTRAFTTTTISFLLMLLNGALAIVAFSGVLWSISPILFIVAVVYAAVGSVLTIVFGRPLIWLNYNQSDKEAGLRADLIQVGEHAESVAILHREHRLSARLQRRIDDLIANLKRTIAVNRNLGFFTTGYNYLIQIIPALIIAPMFMRGEVEFGVITQSSMAFANLLGAFSLIVTQFGSISSYAAVLARLTALGEATERSHAKANIEIREQDETFAYDRLTLRSPRDGRTLVHELTLTIPAGQRLLVTGPNETAQVALFRASAGIWQWGEGRIVRPAHDDVAFIPEQPYLTPGTLRELLVETGSERAVSDDRIHEVLRSLGIENVVTRAGGLDVERAWHNILALGEQQLLAVAHLLLAPPRFTFLDHLVTALTAEQFDRVLGILSEQSIGYVAIGEDEDRARHYDAALDLASDGSWSCQSLQVEALAGAPPTRAT